MLLIKTGSLQLRRVGASRSTPDCSRSSAAVLPVLDETTASYDPWQSFRPAKGFMTTRNTDTATVEAQRRAQWRKTCDVAGMDRLRSNRQAPIGRHIKPRPLRSRGQTLFSDRLCPVLIGFLSHSTPSLILPRNGLQHSLAKALMNSRR